MAERRNNRGRNIGVNHESNRAKFTNSCKMGRGRHTNTELLAMQSKLWLLALHRILLCLAHCLPGLENTGLFSKPLFFKQSCELLMVSFKSL